MDISFEKIENPAAPRDSGLYDSLDEKIKILHETSWRDKWQSQGDQYHLWLDNFKEDERIYAMFLLSKFMYFDTLTWVPLERSAIDVRFLTDRQREWINAYQATVFEKLSPYLNEEEREWLRGETAAI